MHKEYSKPIKTTVHKSGSEISNLTEKLSIELAKENTALGCIFVAKANGEKGFLFSDAMPVDYCLQVLDDIESSIPKAKEYFRRLKN